MSGNCSIYSSFPKEEKRLGDANSLIVDMAIVLEVDGLYGRKVGELSLKVFLLRFDRLEKGINKEEVSGMSLGTGGIVGTLEASSSFLRSLPRC